jgi:L-alanine-DL-glutamate epimerase-like enolase superfamily enzyme
VPTISRVEASPYNVPLKATLKWGQGHELPVLRHVLVRVTLSDGAQGTAESTPRPTIYGETQESVLAIIDRHLAPLITGQSIETLADIDRLSERLKLIQNNQTAKGALDMALHVALARSKAVSLSQLLGITQTRTRVSYIVSTGTTEEVLADVESVYNKGVRVFKVKIGKDMDREIATISQLQTLFPDAGVYVDANQCLDHDSAAVLLNRLSEMGVWYCEEPLPVHQLQQRRDLRTQTRMPIIGDDSCFSLEDVLRELDFHTIDICNIKTARTGFSQSRRILKAVQGSGNGVMVGSQASSLLGCLHTALFSGQDGIDHATECSFFLKTDDDLTCAPQIVDGWLALADVEKSLTRLDSRWQQ